MKLIFCCFDLTKKKCYIAESEMFCMSLPPQGKSITTALSQYVPLSLRRYKYVSTLHNLLILR